MLLGAGQPVAADAELTPSLEVSQAYDDNVFVSATSAEADQFTRATPRLRGSLRTARLDLAGDLSVDAERYATHDELDGAAVRQRAVFDVGYRFDRRSSIALRAEYLATETPAELPTGAGLALGRSRATHLGVAPEYAFAMTPTTRLRLGAAATRETLEGAADSRSASGELGFERAVAPRRRIGLAFRTRAFRADDGTRAGSDALLASWDAALDARNQLSIAAGPRRADGEVRAEIDAVWRYRTARGEVALDYAQTEAQPLDGGGVAEVERLGLGIETGHGRSFQLRLAPLLERVARAGTRSEALRVGLELRYRAARTSVLSWFGRYELLDQQGVIGGAPDDRLERSVVMIGLTLAPAAATPDASGLDAGSPP